MLRSFAYAAETAYRGLGDRFPEIGPEIIGVAQAWRGQCESAFMVAYAKAMKGSPSWVKLASDRNRLLGFHLLKRALYEVVYEANNRPDWVEVPCVGVIEILNKQASS